MERIAHGTETVGFRPFRETHPSFRNCPRGASSNRGARAARKRAVPLNRRKRRFPQLIRWNASSMRAELSTAGDSPVIEVRALRKVYANRGLFAGRGGVTAIDGVSLTLSRGRTLALVGESGCGKSTLARCLVRLEKFTSGEIRFQGADFLALHGEQLRRTRRRIQLIFQEPLEALNPRFSALEVVREPLVICRDVGRRQGVERAHTVMELVGLSSAWGSRRVQEFS